MRYRCSLTRHALPILLLATPLAQAQNNVMIYGVADVTVESAKGAPGSGGRVSSNSSVLGFRGTEALGNGLSAIWQIEGGASLDTGAGGLNTRDTFVGLTGQFGTFKMGLFSPPMRALTGRVSFVPGGSSVANNLGLFTTLNGVLTNLNSRLPNAIQYATPQMGAFNGTFIYAPGEN
jgi:predicted porin